MLTDPELRSQVDALSSMRLRSSSRTPKSEPHKPPLDMFGADAVERWFTDKEVEEVINFVSKLEMNRNDN